MVAVKLFFIPRTSGRALLGCLICWWLAASGGCGNTGSSGVAVSGRVTVDAVPVENGTISFSPTDGASGPTAGASIENGVYSISGDQGPAKGMNLVAIYGGRKTGKQVRSRRGALVDQVISVVPERYNNQSTLKRELKPGKNVLDFELSSK
jgi:hypothetical protein